MPLKHSNRRRTRKHKAAMGRGKSLSLGRRAALLTMGAALLSSSCSTTSVEAAGAGGLRRKRTSSDQYRSSSPPPEEPSASGHDVEGGGGGGRLASGREKAAESPVVGAGAHDDVGEDLARKFFLPSSDRRKGATAANTRLQDIDMRQLILEMNMGGSMSIMTEEPTRSPTRRPTESPTVNTAPPSISTAPTLTNCENPGTCQNRLRSQIYAVSVRVGTTDALDDPNSAQSKAVDWIIEECDATVPIDPCTESQIILNEQRYALAVMYFSLGGDGWNAGSNVGQDKGASAGVWMSGLNYCEWGTEISGANGSYNQLVCDESGNVLNLNLQSNNMVGQIPPEVGALVYMTSYISFFNAQSGPIPTSLGLITPLETFDVESNNMDGDLFQPEYAGPDGLLNIVNWRASLNNFRGNIPSDIGRWTRLQNLWFADNEITGTIPNDVGNLVDMNAFLFYKNQIAGTIPVEIGNLNKLTWIDMEDNQVVGTIPEEFYSNVELEEVIFKNNSLSGTISDKVGDLTKLATFWASFNEISGTIPSSFGNCLNLEELELQENNFGGTIPSEFGNMESIEFLSMENNDLTGSIPPELFGINLIGLRILYLNDNELSGVVPENMGQSPRLKDFWLNDNKITGTLPIIAEGEFLFLEELLINNNDITGEVDESLCLIRNDTIPGGNLGVFHADCQPSSDGGAPQILCTCCTACFV